MPLVSPAELRDQAARMREFARSVSEPEVLSEINAMIEERETLAQHLEALGGGRA